MKKFPVVFLLLLLGIVFFCWDFAFLYPLKLLVVFFHEISHGLAAVFTGGSIEKIELVAAQGGVCYTRGGSQFLILNAGYLGSLLSGSFLYLTTIYFRNSRVIMGFLGIFTLWICIFYLRNLFGFFFVFVSSLTMIFFAFKLPEKLNNLVLRFIGLTSMMYVLQDIYSDTIQRAYLRSDARMLAEAYGGHTMIWGGLWIFMSVVLIIFSFYISIRMEKNQDKD